MVAFSIEKAYTVLDFARSAPRLIGILRLPTPVSDFAKYSGLFWEEY